MFEKTELVRVIGISGYDAIHDGTKISIQLRNGQQYYIWYYAYDDGIIPHEGLAVNLSYSLDNYSAIDQLYKITNIGTGKETRIKRFAKIN